LNTVVAVTGQRDPADVQAGTPLGVGHTLDRRELRRLVLGHRPAEQVADTDLERGHYCRQ